MNRHLLVGTALVAVLAGGVGAADSVGPTRSVDIRTASEVPIAGITEICPELGIEAGPTASLTVTAAPASARGTGEVDIAQLGGRPVRVLGAAGPVASLVPTGVHGAVVTARGRLASGLEVEETSQVEQGPGRAWFGTRCVAPGGDPYFVDASGVLGNRDVLGLFNPDPATAVVDLQAWGPNGPLDLPAAQGIQVDGTSRLIMLIDAIGPNLPLVAVHVVTRTGRVVAALYDQRLTGQNPRGIDYLAPAGPPSTDSVVPGFVGGAGSRSLDLLDPDATDATVTVHVLSADGSFVPSGLEHVLVRAGTTVRVDLGRALGGQPAGVRVTSDEPVVAAGFENLTARGLPYADVCYTAAAPALSGPTPVSEIASGSVTSSSLVLSAPGPAAQVTIDVIGGRSRTVTVPAGGTVSVEVSGLLRPHARTGGLVATPLPGSGPVYAAREIYEAGAQGPLITLLPLVTPVRTVSVPAVVLDLQVGAAG
ncbi:MAG TPA: DUF5719 family protein [Mycobacteriales bacterium]|nr:DUF5719 family protein [Mycobacteriales bacterium]